MSKPKPTVVYLLVLLFMAWPAEAALNIGEQAPDFTAQASIGGKEFTFVLADALKQGPVVLYFYPAAFTPGCTVEAHDFAEATDDFKRQGASVIGVSHDTIATLDKFSVTECRSKFAVVADTDGSIMQAYDAVLSTTLGTASRISYLITPDHKILYGYKAVSPDEHVAYTMRALQKWHAAHNPYIP